MVRNCAPARDCGTLSRLRCPGYIYFSNQQRNLVSPLRLSRLSVSSTFFFIARWLLGLRAPNNIYSYGSARCTLSTRSLYSRVRSCAYQRHVTTLVTVFDAAHHGETNLTGSRRDDRLLQLRRVSQRMFKRTQKYKVHSVNFLLNGTLTAVLRVSILLQ